MVKENIRNLKEIDDAGNKPVVGYEFNKLITSIWKGVQ
jgi:hypothetical protein